ncbi:hypothetical protein [Cytobacillus oceanisediminis]|uniref:hypothetical protein n=1 Tax=Cytobacillus oceanisediminis TaxID=665099 RepID=UPI002079B659|nr:hypothetical protein [Cytobacillus oceanisediminis]USK43717.1 hypothetical protein LIT27_24580 [Cytobacillus oceanisediminis]
MKIFIDVNPDTKRVEGWGTSPISANCFKIEVDDNHEIMDHPFFYVYSNGEIMRDEDYRQKLIADEEAKRNAPSPIEVLQMENERLKEEKKVTDLAILELAQLLMGG